MEEPATSTTTNENWAGQYVHMLAQQRSRVQEFLAAQRLRLQKAQADLAEQLGRLGEEAERNRGHAPQAREDLRRRSEEIARQTDNLARLQEEFQSRQAEWDKAQQRASQHLNHLAEQVHREQNELVSRREELERRQARMDTAAARLHHDQQSLALEREEHRAQAEHVAGLRQRFEANLAALESLRGQYEQIQRQAASVPTEACQAEIQTLQIERDNLAQRLSETEQRLHPLVARLSEAERQLEETTRDDSADDLRRRYEMALEDVRDLKSRNQELERQLAKPRASATSSDNPAGQWLDWEAQKSRILAALESDFDPQKDEDKRDRLKIEEVVHQTDRILAEKDREILDLKQLLENQSSNLGEVAVGAAALGEILDQDAIIQEERANLRRLQEEWEEKMRQAEIEISMERATIARHRAEIEGHSPPTDPAAGQSRAESSTSPKPARGRWLNLLGLAGPDKE